MISPNPLTLLMPSFISISSLFSYIVISHPIMNSSSSSRKPDVTLSLNLPPSPTINNELKSENGAKLIQLLLTCASHTSSGNLHHADACLREISQLASVTGDSMQRLAARFASALATRLVKRWPGLYKALTNGGKVGPCDFDRARSIFVRSLPYMGFAYAIINRTLIQAMSGERLIHVIDLGYCDSKLWVSFIQGIAGGADGPYGFDGPLCLKITCVSRNKEAKQKLGNRLVKEAMSLNISFQFYFINVCLKDLTLNMLNVESGETVALISILDLHVLLVEDDRINSHFGLNKSNEVKICKQMNEFLEMVKSIGPKVMLLVEQESDHNSNRLVDRFVEGLHFYSALFDSIEVTFGGLSCSNRTKLEDMFGKEIESIIAREGLEREERHERYVKWAARFKRAGFRPVRLWYDSMEEAREVAQAYGPKGFKVISEKGSLMICWHDRPIYAVSAWDCFSL